jgi:glycosyltransferase involved in cell wall biosynthesis
MDYPLVSCVTPTYNRRHFFPRAIRCFLSQDYPNLEWVILDDGTDPIKDILPDDPRIKYHHIPSKRAHGPKMDYSFELAAGEYGIVFDDDDWYAPDRVRLQVEPLIANPSFQVSGLSNFYYYDTGKQVAYLYQSKQVPWIGAIALRRSSWASIRFDNDPKPGADNRLLMKIPKDARCDIKDLPRLLVAAIHPQNDCHKHITSSYMGVPYDTVVQITGGDL